MSRMTNLTSGLLVAIEGSDAAGKSTLAAALSGLSDTVLVRQPGGTPVAEALRGIFKQNWDNEVIDPMSEIMMLMAARRQIYTGVVRPALLEGKTVILDRHLLSTLVYQHDRLPDPVISDTEIAALNNRVFPVQPDLTIFLHVDQETANERLSFRGEAVKLDRIEASINLSNIITSYNHRVSRALDRATTFAHISFTEELVVIDTVTNGIEAVKEQAVSFIEDHLARRVR